LTDLYACKSSAFNSWPTLYICDMDLLAKHQHVSNLVFPINHSYSSKESLFIWKSFSSNKNVQVHKTSPDRGGVRLKHSSFQGSLELS